VVRDIFCPVNGRTILSFLTIQQHFFIPRKRSASWRTNRQVGDEAISINARSATQSGTQNPDRKVVGFLFLGFVRQPCTITVQGQLADLSLEFDFFIPSLP